MLIFVKKIEMVDGETINKNWSAPMYVVNDTWLASTIDKDNIGGKPFDLVVGQNAVVEIEEGRNTKMPWIIGKS